MPFCGPGLQEHADGLASRLRQREEDLAEATALLTDARRDLTTLRNKAKDNEQVSWSDDRT